MIINMNISICKSISITKLLSFDVYLYVISTFRIYINSHLSHIYLVRRDPGWGGGPAAHCDYFYFGLILILSFVAWFSQSESIL